MTFPTVQRRASGSGHRAGHGDRPGLRVRITGGVTIVTFDGTTMLFEEDLVREVSDRLPGLFDPGRRVFVNHPATVTHHDIVSACRKLQRAGFIPVAHVAARRLASFTQARDYIERAAGEASILSAKV